MSQTVTATDGKTLSKATKRKKSKRRPFSMTKRKNDNVLKITTQLTDEERKQVHDSFAWAFYAKKLSYTTKLVYDSPQCQAEANDP